MSNRLLVLNWLELGIELGITHLADFTSITNLFILESGVLKQDKYKTVQ